MAKLRDQSWSVLFAASVGVLMATILLIRSEPVDSWVLIVYPLVGALLGLAASRTSPTVEQIAWLESGTIAAAATVVLACLVNVLLLDMLLRQIRTGLMLDGAPLPQVMFFAAPAVAVLFWWALQRRLHRLRLAGAEQDRPLTRTGIAAE